MPTSVRQNEKRENKMSEFTLDSGAKLVVVPAMFKDGMPLAMAFIRALKKAEVDQNLEIEEALDKVAVEEEIISKTMACSTRALWNGRHIDDALFDDPRVGVQATSDFPKMLNIILMENLKPFFPKAFSASTGVSDAATSQGQK